MNKRYKQKRYRRKARVSRKMKKAIRSTIQKELQPETKFWLKRAAGIAIDTGTNAQQFLLTDVPIYVPTLATTQLNDQVRIGDKVKIKYVHIKGWINPSATATGDIIRFVVFQWKDNNISNAPTIDKIFLAGSSGTYSADSHYSKDYLDANTFTVLYDKTVGEELGTGTVGVRPFNIRVPMKYAKKTVAFIGGGLSAANHIYFLVLSTRAPAGTDSVVLNYVSMFGFTDD